MLQFVLTIFNRSLEKVRSAQLMMLRGQVRVQSGQLLGLSEAVALPPELTDWHNRDLSHPFY